MISRVVAFVLGAVFSCIITKDYYETKHQAFIEKLNATNTEIQQKQLRTELELREVIDDLLEESHDRAMEIERLSADNAKLVRELGGLRDPGNSYSSRPSKDKNSGSDTKTGAGTVLSDEATEFLLDLTKEADLVREQLRLCQEWAKSLEL